MRELLERWARLEPKRCDIAHPGSSVCAWVRFRGLTSWSERRIGLDDADPYEEMLVLRAVIEAIEARGWSFRARHLVGHSEASVEVRSAQSPLVWPYKATADTFTKALLGAYLAAQEAEGDQ